MIAIDSNIFLRLFLPKESSDKMVKIAQEFVLNQINLDEKFFINNLVLAESFWTLKSFYKVPAKMIMDQFLEVLKNNSFEFEDKYTVKNAIKNAANKKADFPDSLILETNKRNNIRETFTFDQKAIDRLGFKK